MQHFLDVTDLSAAELNGLLDEAMHLKGLERATAPRPLAGKIVGLIFEKPSLRTRVSFEAAAFRLGGMALFYSGEEIGLGRREPLADFARVMSQYVDALVLRVFRHSTVTETASLSSVPVINGLSDLAHPCQAMADLLTIREAFGTVAGKTVAFVGDGNNVARSLARACSMFGARFILARPDGYGFEPKFVSNLTGVSETTDATLGVRDADVIYTDVWTSMGQEAEKAERLRRFAGYQVNAELLKSAPPHAKVLHCLPAHRGEEIAADVLDGPRSLAIPQAANRMHFQAALLARLMTGTR